MRVARPQSPSLNTIISLGYECVIAFASEKFRPQIFFLHILGEIGGLSTCKAHGDRPGLSLEFIDEIGARPCQESLG